MDFAYENACLNPPGLIRLEYSCQSRPDLIRKVMPISKEKSGQPDQVMGIFLYEFMPAHLRLACQVSKSKSEEACQNSTC